MKRDEGAGHRHGRLEQLVLEELRALMRDDVHDPRLSPVRINAARLSVDYRHARIHFAVASPMGPRELRAVERSLARAAPFLRARLADAVEMKRIPELRFVADPSPAQVEASIGAPDSPDDVEAMSGNGDESEAP